jgi:D-tyrosyl-tRNA(Tyr) deacylase
MRAVVQRVAWAKVEVEGEVVGAIERGLLVYVGFKKGDTDTDQNYVLGKVLGLRIFQDEATHKMDKSVLDVGGKLLVVSQFTLYGDVRKGRRPSFDDAMPPDEAERAYEAFIRHARVICPIETGKFRADMKVSSLNDGPVTIWIDSEKSG